MGENICKIKPRIRMVIWCSRAMFDSEGHTKHADVVNKLKMNNIQNVLLIEENNKIDEFKQNDFVHIVVSDDISQSIDKVRENFFLKPNEIAIVTDYTNKDSLDISGSMIVDENDCSRLVNEQCNKTSYGVSDEPEEVIKYRKCTDTNEKIKLLHEIVAKFKSKWAKYELVDILIKNGSEDDLKEAYAICNTSSSRNDPEMVVRLAKMFKEGRGVQKSQDEYSKLIKSSIDKKSSMAQYDWAEFVIKNKIENEYTYVHKMCMNSDDPRLRAYVSRMYKDGLGVNRDLDKSIELMKQASSSNLGWIKNELTDLLILRGKPDDLKEAFDLCSSFALSGDHWALGRLARMYRDGKGVQKDTQKAIELMKVSSEAGVSWASDELIGMLLSRGTYDDINDSLKLISSSLQKKRMISLLKSTLETIDTDKSRQIVRDISINEANIDDNIRLDLAQLIIEFGNDDDKSQLCETYRKMATQGNRDACYMLGKMYRDGIGTGVNIDNAIFFIHSSINGISDKHLGEYIDLLIKRRKEGDFREAFELCKAGSDNGNPWSTGRLARMYRDGHHVGKDIDAAIKYMRIAYTSGVSWARNELINLLRVRGLPEDVKEIKKINAGI